MDNKDYKSTAYTTQNDKYKLVDYCKDGNPPRERDVVNDYLLLKGNLELLFPNMKSSFTHELRNGSWVTTLEFDKYFKSPGGVDMYIGDLHVN